MRTSERVSCGGELNGERGLMAVDLAALPLEGIGVVGIVATIGYLVFRGVLMPRPVVQDLVKSRDDRIAELATERDKWESAANTALEALREQSDQIGELMEYARTTDSFIRALPRGGNRR